MPSVFISHAAADADLATALFELLQKGCNLQTTDIYCTSVEGSGVETGEQFTRHIRAHLEGANVVILLVTPMYFSRPFCVAELGAAWGLGKQTFPLVVAGVPRELGANMLGTHTQALDATGLDHLKDRIEALDLGRAKVATARWTAVRDRSLKEMGDLVAALRKPDSVPRADLAAAEERREAALELANEAETEIKRLKQQVAALERAKDARDVRQVRTEFSTAEEQYEQLRKEARDALRGLNAAEHRVLFAMVQGESEWAPSDWMSVDSSAIAAATNRKTLLAHEVGIDAVVYTPNLAHPTMREAQEAVDAVRTFLEGTTGREVCERLRQDGELPEIDSSDFWRSQLLDGRGLWS